MIPIEIRAQQIIRKTDGMKLVKPGTVGYMITQSAVIEALQESVTNEQKTELRRLIIREIGAYELINRVHRGHSNLTIEEARLKLGQATSDLNNFINEL